MAAFWDDYDDLLGKLRKLRGVAGLKVSTIERGPAGEFHESEWRADGLGEPKALRLPGSDSAVLVLGDLGQFKPTAGSVAAWRWLGRRLRDRGVRPWVLTPCPPSRWSPQLARIWQQAHWDRGRRLPTSGTGQRARPLTPETLETEQKRQMQRLRVLVSPAVRVERGLLRDIRLLCSSTELDAGAEFDLWDSDWTSGKVLGFSLNADASREGRTRLRELDDRRLVSVVQTIRRHHAYSSDVFGAMEIFILRDFLQGLRMRS
jgi:hypothetical protein